MDTTPADVSTPPAIDTGAELNDIQLEAPVLSEPVNVKMVVSRKPMIISVFLILVGYGASLTWHLWEQAPWWLVYVAAGLALMGSFIHSTYRTDRIRLIGVAVMGTLSALAIASELWWMLWPSLAPTLGYLSVWAFARGRRGRWFTLITFVLIHLSTATYGLMQVVAEGSVWWSMVHGLLTLIGGAGLIVWSGSGTTKMRSYALRIGRVAILLSLFLPYVVLLLMGMRDL